VVGRSSKFTIGGCGAVTTRWSRLLTSDGACVRRYMVRPMGGRGGMSFITTHVILGWDSAGGALLVLFCVARDIVDEQLVVPCK
jgi:hypothetical protein